MKVASVTDPDGFRHDKVFPGTEEDYRSAVLVRHMESGRWFAISWSRAYTPSSTHVANARKRLRATSWPYQVVETSIRVFN